MTLRIILTRETGWPDDDPADRRSTEELAAALRAAGQQVRVVTTAPTPGRGEQRGVDVRYLRRRERSGFGLQTLAHSAAARADVWHAFGLGDAVAAATLATVRRGLCSVYTDHGFCEPTRSARERTMRAVVVKQIDHYVCISNAAAESYRACHSSGQPPVVIPPGIEVRRFEAGARRHPTPVLLFAADASNRRNNLPLLLDALAMLRWRRPDIELWLAGPGRQGDVVASAPPAAKDGTTLLGEQDPGGMADIYGRAWVTVLPAEREPFGLSLVESLASGTPVVALGADGPAEIVRPGVGVTVPSPATAAGLADACEAAVDLASEPGVAADCRAAAWTWDWSTAIIPRLLRLYHHQV